MTEQFNDKDSIIENELTTNKTTDTMTTASTPKQSKTKNMSFLYGLAGGVIGAGLIFGTSMVLGQQGTTTTSQLITTISAQTPKNNSVTTSDDASVINAVSKAQGAVVSIANYQYSSGSSSLNNFFNTQSSKSLEKAGEGSGVIYKSENGYAYIVTNNHVIDNANEINVQLKDGTTVKGELIGTDKLTDLAVVRIKNEHVKSVATFANSDTVQTGQTVLAIGSPLGAKLASSVTKGIVSANNRSVDIDTNGDKINDWSMETIQTDAAINPGNSGGALVDLNGQVIGINSMKISNTSVEGIGFAIPSNQVIDIINKLEKDGAVTRPVLGISLADLSNISTSQRESFLSLPHDVSGGVIISSVQQTGSANAAGLQRFDVITAINDQAITDSLTFRKALYKHKVGDTITLSYYRDGKLNKAKVTLK